MAATYHVYVLQNPDGRFYIGLSEDVPKRLQQHNLSLSRWPRSRGDSSISWIPASRQL